MKMENKSGIVPTLAVSCEDFEKIKKSIEEKDKEIERLKKREQECMDHYLVQCKYASEMEDKYIIANNIINELEKWLENEIKFRKVVDKDFELRKVLNILQILKGSDKE